MPKAQAQFWANFRSFSWVWTIISAICMIAFIVWGATVDNGDAWLACMISIISTGLGVSGICYGSSKKSEVEEYGYNIRRLACMEETPCATTAIHTVICVSLIASALYLLLKVYRARKIAEAQRVPLESVQIEV